jgi:hypothetical protein
MKLLAFPALFTSFSLSHAADFAQQVQPLLAKHCLECHGPDKQKGSFRLDLKQAALKGGDSGPAILPGNSAESPLIAHISAPIDDAMAMPPKGPRLANSDVSLLRQWIDQGAPWPAELAGADPRLTHWSVQPLRSLSPPASAFTHPIDAFISAKLSEHDLSFSPEADPRTLARRLHFDLLGLPPDFSSTASTPYETLVDQLLASPHFGERQARHWLDIAHYADTHGFERDQLRPHAWRYRDYVIDAFNQDKPYDQFLREQIAGDTLEPPVIPALGFLAAGPWDFVGHVETKSDLLKRAARAGDLDDIVTQVMTSTLGITMNCARCHDHKLDPITQQEYFQLCAVFAGIKRADRDADPAQSQHLQIEKNRLETEITTTRAQLDRSTGTALDLAKQLPEQSGIDLRTGRLTQEKLGYHRDLPANHSQPVPAVAAILSVFVPNGHPSGIPNTSGHAWDAIANRPLNAQQSTVLNGIDYAKPEHSLLAMHANSGLTWDLNVLRLATGPKALRLTGLIGFGAGPNAAASLADFSVLIDGVLAFQKLKLRKDQTATLNLEIPPAATTLSFIATDGGDGISSDLLFIGDPKLTPIFPPENLSPTEQQKIAALRRHLTTLEAELKALPEPERVYAFTAEQIPPIIRVQRRGNPEDEAQEVTPGAFTWLNHAPPELGDHQTPEHQRRRRLADWITAPTNPLTARVIVNRLWHHHFGQGLVTTPSDFGLGGDLPSHPELLDFLAHELIANGWRLKPLHRLIVTSKTYRQRSTSPPSADSANRLLARQNPRRLDAETLRDTVLAVSGQLNLQRGGPGFRDFHYTEAYAPIYDYTTPNTPEQWKRSIYRFIVRTTPHQFLTTLDCPDPANLTPARVQTTTALQALALSNNEFMLQQADFLAKRLQAETTSPTAAITRAFQLCFQRPPSQQELQAAQKLDLFALCRTLMNANEFIYVD